MLLLDTSSLIDVFINRKGSEKIREYVRNKEYTVSSITVYELYKAKYLDQRLEHFLRNIDIVDFSFLPAEHASKIFITLKNNGISINEMDILIAGVATSHQLELITKDKDFEKIKKIIPTFQVTVF